MYQSDHSLVEAIRLGNIDQVVDSIREGNYSDSTNIYTNEACKCGHVRILRYLLYRRFQLSEWAVSYAACKGHLEILKYLRGIDYKFTLGYRACFEAITNGHLECLKYLFTIPMPRDENIDLVETAIKYEQIEILSYLLDRHKIVSKKAWINAPRKSAVYLHEVIPNQCPIVECYHCKRKLILDHVNDGYLSWLSYDLIEELS